MFLKDRPVYFKDVLLFVSVYEEIYLFYKSEMLKNHEAAESPFMLAWVTSVSTSPRIHNFKYKKILPAQGSVLVLCTKFNVQIGATL